MKNKKLLLVLILGLVAVFVVVIYLSGFQKNNKETSSFQSPTPTKSQLKTFQSKNFDFIVNLPHEFEVKEGLSYIEFHGKGGTIDFGRNDASGDGDLKHFLINFDEKNEIKDISEMRDLKINSFPAISRVELRGKIYAKLFYIYVDDWVYVFSTDSKELYDDLEKIVQSFRYTP